MKTIINSNNSELKTLISEIDHVPELKIPESQGDFVDQSQDQIDSDMHEKLYQIRQNLKRIESSKYTLIK